MPIYHQKSLLGTFATLWLILPGCAPRGDKGECVVDTDCDRGQVCDVEAAICVAADVDVSSTEDPAPASFTAKPVPFFRGQVCLVHDVKAGANVPVYLNPCLHPCITARGFHHQHYYECLGSRCKAWATMYVDADASAEGCPADAFGRFDRAQCAWGPSTEISITTTLAGEPVVGSMAFEVPFLSNADIAYVVEAGNDGQELQARLRERIRQYPQEPGRVPGSREINLSPNLPEPPEACEGDANCECYDVGF